MCTGGKSFHEQTSYTGEMSSTIKLETQYHACELSIFIGYQSDCDYVKYCL